jgi:hypothetical protein
LMPLGLILPKIIILDQQWIDHLKLQKKWRWSIGFQNGQVPKKGIGFAKTCPFNKMGAVATNI